jgi:ATP-dependent Clp protease ATP-binding subunit ClpA
MYGDQKALQFFDMSQYGQPHACSTLFGQSKGYVGSDSYGKLTAALRDYPKCIVLLDEFEKAHTEVHKRFLTAWNDGFITESSDGKKISTTEAVFIVTTNAASEKVGELAKTYADDRDMLVKTTKTCLQEAGFAPEVLSRIDHVFAFCSLEGMDVARVVSLEVIALLEQYDLKLADQGIDPQILLDAIAKSDKGLQTNVREIARSIEQQMGDSLLEAKEAGAKSVRIIEMNGAILAEAVEFNP